VSKIQKICVKNISVKNNDPENDIILTNKNYHKTGGYHNVHTKETVSKKLIKNFLILTFSLE